MVVASTEVTVPTVRVREICVKSVAGGGVTNEVRTTVESGRASRQRVVRVEGSAYTVVVWVRVCSMTIFEGKEG